MLERAGCPRRRPGCRRRAAGRPAVPGARQAAPGLRGAPHLPLRRSGAARVLPALHAGGERHPAGPARRVQHRLPRRPRRPPPRGGAPGMIQAKGGEQIKGETLDDPQLTELGRRPSRPARPRRAQHRPMLPRGTGDPRHHRHQHPLRGAFPLPQAAGAAYPETIIAIAAGERPPARVGAHVAGVVMTQFLDQTILRREPSGLAPSRASTRVRRTWSARSPSGTTAACCGAAVGSSSPRPSSPRSWASS